MENLMYPQKADVMGSATTLHKTMAFLALCLASAGFVVTVLWPLVAN